MRATSVAAGQELRPVGLVPDEVLLRCGAPDSVPSTWWTPWLAAADEEHVVQLRAAADAYLREQGVLDTGGRLHGLLAEVAEVVRGATSALLIDGRDAAGAAVRRAVLVTPDRALLDLHEPDHGAHDLVLATPRGAVAALVGLLDPADRCRRRSALEVVAADELPTHLPPDRRIATTRIVQVDADGEQARTVTVIEDEDGLAAVWALAEPAGHVGVARLDEAALVELARALLGATEVA